MRGSLSVGRAGTTAGPTTVLVLLLLLVAVSMWLLLLLSVASLLVVLRLLSLLLLLLLWVTGWTVLEVCHHLRCLVRLRMGRQSVRVRVVVCHRTKAIDGTSCKGGNYSTVPAYN